MTKAPFFKRQCLERIEQDLLIIEMVSDESKRQASSELIEDLKKRIYENIEEARAFLGLIFLNSLPGENESLETIKKDYEEGRINDLEMHAIAKVFFEHFKIIMHNKIKLLRQIDPSKQ